MSESGKGSKASSGAGTSRAERPAPSSFVTGVPDCTAGAVSSSPEAGPRSRANLAAMACTVGVAETSCGAMRIFRSRLIRWNRSRLMSESMPRLVRLTSSGMASSSRRRKPAISFLR